MFYQQLIDTQSSKFASSKRASSALGSNSLNSLSSKSIKINQNVYKGAQ